ncbi:MFS transporter [Nonomuraea sp. GTA35]|uniref:MFS transporter n=1 Tax=Nonomuraea sp. GTA35 TaxID=1676746 RepID=UPI0035C25177
MARLLSRTPSGSGGIRLRSAFLVSSVGDWIYRFAAPTLILQITGSALSAALAYVLEFIPYIVVGLVAGVIADRWDRRRILIICDCLSFAIALVIVFVAAADRPSVALLYLCAFLLASVRPFYFPAFQGFVVDIVPKERLSRINAWTQTVDSSLAFVGPVVGTAFIAALGVPLATLVNALTFAISALLILQIANVHTRVAPAGGVRAELSGVGRDFLQGLRILRSIRPIWWGTLLMAAANFAGFVIEGNLVYLILEVEHLPGVALGVVFGAQGLGAVLGALVAPRLIDRHPTGRLLAYGMALSALAMALPVVLPAVWVIAAAWAVEGVATSVIVVSWFTARQTVVPADAIGRVASVSRAAAYATIPAGAVVGGAVVGGALAAWGGPGRMLFLCAALVQTAVAVGTALSPLRDIDQAAPAATTSGDT